VHGQQATCAAGCKPRSGVRVRARPSCAHIASRRGRTAAGSPGGEPAGGGARLSLTFFCSCLWYALCASRAIRSCRPPTVSSARARSAPAPHRSPPRAPCLPPPRRCCGAAASPRPAPPAAPAPRPLSTSVPRPAPPCLRRTQRDGLYRPGGQGLGHRPMWPVNRLQTSQIKP
jgi:hypothetical protein